MSILQSVIEFQTFVETRIQSSTQKKQTIHILSHFQDEANTVCKKVEEKE